MTQRPLSADALRNRVDPDTLGFDTTAELEPLGRLVGQDRPLDALEFGSAIAAHGFNIFVLGAEGTGRRDAALAELRRRAADRPPPDDWCYTNNFDDPRRPRALRLPHGRARKLAEDMEGLAAHFATDLPRVFSSDEYRARRNAIVQWLERQRGEVLAEAEAEAERRGFAVIHGPQGIALVPKRDGEAMTDEEIGKLEAREREALQEARTRLQARFEEALPRLADVIGEARDRLRDVNRATASVAASQVLEPLRRRYHELPQVLEFLAAVERDLLNLIGRLATMAEADPEVLARTVASDEFQRRYMVNVVVGHELSHAPVIEEPNPTFANLLGRIEHRVLQGMLTTDFLMIRAGALLRGNAGYVLLDALEVLRRPLAWDALKRALRQSEVRIEEPGAELGLISTVSLQPEPIPLDVKVVLVGPPILYYLLSALDPDFDRIFKVQAEFAPTLPRTAETESQYARFVAARCRAEGIPHFDAGAVAALIEHGSRMAGDQTRLSARLGEIADLIREASFIHGRRAADGGVDPVVARADVDAAIAARVRRANRLEEELHRHIEAGTLLVRTRGTAVGAVNGLSVMVLNDYAFAKPVRVTATVAMGTRGVVDIERESTLGGPIHSKGVLILSGFLHGRYGGGRPLVLSASLAFEQVYEPVEGDSASFAELVALLSALADLPVRQDLAVTGSVNQHGDAQPVGGVTEKVEGFFHACRIQGFSGAQGVIVPARNVRHLMLRDEVTAAVAAGRFRILEASHVDDVIELLFDRPAAEVHRAVEARLEGFIAAWRRLRLELGLPPEGPMGARGQPPAGRRARGRDRHDAA